MEASNTPIVPGQRAPFHLHAGKIGAFVGGSRLRQADENMTYYKAAIEVLKAAKRPLTVREITNLAIEAGLITPRGKTPAATMSAALYRARNHPDLVSAGDRGDKRAKRGTVRWTLRPSQTE